MNIPVGELIVLIFAGIMVMTVLVHMNKDIEADIRNDIIMEDKDDDFLR